MNKPNLSNGELAPGEPHPSASVAILYLKTLPLKKLMRCREAFASTAISGNRFGDVCLETLRRIMSGEPVSDRYVLGLAWSIKAMENELGD